MTTSVPVSFNSSHFRWVLLINDRPHWEARTRARCREELKALKAQCGGRLPTGVRATIRRTV